MFNHNGYSYLSYSTFNEDPTNGGSTVENDYGATMNLAHCTIESCSTPGVGGGLYNGGTATLTDCTIAGNTAGSGAAAWPTASFMIRPS